MNNRQRAAVCAVEEAMVELKASGLILAGVDDCLIAFSRRQYYKLPKTVFGNVPAPAEIINELDHLIIDCPYIDSGGT